MANINGFIIIAHRPRREDKPEDGLVIFGSKVTPYGYEYATAVVDSLDDKDWSWGHYFNTYDGPNAINRALDDYKER